MVRDILALDDDNVYEVEKNLFRKKSTKHIFDLKKKIKIEILKWCVLRSKYFT